MWSSEVTNMIITGIWETLYMTLVSTLVGYVIGLPMGIILTVSDKDGIKPNEVLYKILDVIENMVLIVPYIARMVESSLKEVDAGVIEAARSMGASNFTIITKVMLVEARTSLLVGATITLGTILGYSAMSGAVGGGGLGAIAIRYGYTRWQTDIMIVTVILLIILFQIFQTVGMKLADKFDHRK